MTTPKRLWIEDENQGQGRLSLPSVDFGRLAKEARASGAFHALCTFTDPELRLHPLHFERFLADRLKTIERVIRDERERLLTQSKET